ncbi:MAG: tRNA-intron lyase [Candidatus Aenigmatarchaeota archaeon]|nr:MAG: tRNA-intron lyase [Candidatus Aenigmarchaeota archaeon]
MTELNFDPKKGIWCEDEEGLEKLEKNHFGEKEKNRIWLDIEEALFLMNFQNAVCKGSTGKEIGFNELASHYADKEPRLFIRYNAYRDWRDRGLVARRMKGIKKGQGKKGWKRYPAKDMKLKRLKAKAVWYPDSLFSVIEDKKTGKNLFDDHWIGQLGIYKQNRGDLLKLNFIETIFLSKHAGLDVTDSVTGKNMKPEDILKFVVGKREYAKQLYEIYEDWRLKGYVVKTGFKFGSHFRIYFPGANPTKSDKWVHSKHVLHVFPKDQKLLISEWSRAVRVAHGVKKTFLLGIPEMKKPDYIDYPVDFLAYRRKKEGTNWVRETPEDRPRYLLVAVSEDEHIGGIELASLLRMAQTLGLELLLSISDRETAITYYVLKRVVLPGSGYEYYEIEWMKP